MDKILIIDCGSQYTGLIARRIRESGVYSEIIPATLTDLKDYLTPPVKGLVLSGGPHCSLETDSLPLLAELTEIRRPFLGICFGFQWMADQAGGEVSAAHQVSEYGQSEFRIRKDHPLLQGVPSPSQVWMSHEDAVTAVPDSLEVLGQTRHHIAAFAFADRPWFGLQFHPEVQHTDFGREILDNFLFQICQVEKSWSPENQEETILNQIRHEVGDRKVIQAVSGGVDSTVASVLLERALPGQTLFVTVDTGLLREGEAQAVVHNFRRHFSINVHLIDYRQPMLDNLEGITDPEEKRIVIGHTFIEAFTHFLKDHPEVECLGQGTLYTDVIESVSVVGPSHTIKSHHNVGGLPENLHLDLVEPLRMLYKDEVRRLGRHMGIPDSMIDKKPFPGPGLAIRTIGPITKEGLKILRQAHTIVEEEIEKSEKYPQIWQAFPLLLNMKTVGVKGDRRSYDSVIALRIVESQDGMTARWLPVETEILERISRRLCNEISRVGRVVLDLTSKPPGTIEWE